MEINIDEIRKEAAEHISEGKAEAIKELIEDYPILVSAIPNNILDTILEYAFRQGFNRGMKYISDKFLR